MPPRTPLKGGVARRWKRRGKSRENGPGTSLTPLSPCPMSYKRLVIRSAVAHLSQIVPPPRSTRARAGYFRPERGEDLRETVACDDWDPCELTAAIGQSSLPPPLRHVSLSTARRTPTRAPSFYDVRRVSRDGMNVAENRPPGGSIDFPPLTLPRGTLSEPPEYPADNERRRCGKPPRGSPVLKPRTQRRDDERELRDSNGG